MSNLEETLVRLFERYRILFWYDADGVLAERYKDVKLPGVEKIEVDGTPFRVKCRVLHEEPMQQFLLYFRHARPEPAQDWLLDIYLAHYEFRTDKISIFIQETPGLTEEYRAVVNDHSEFFNSQERRQAISKRLVPDDTPEKVRFKLLAVVFGSEEISLEAYLLAYFKLLAAGQEAGVEKELERYSLREPFWGLVNQRYGYMSKAPSIYGFLLELFGHHFPLEALGSLTAEADVLLPRWKNDLRYRESFRTLSERVAGDLDVEARLNSADLDTLLADDLFSLTEQRILAELVQRLVAGQIPPERVTRVVKERSNRFFYPDYQSFYEALSYAAQLLETVAAPLPAWSNPAAALEWYTSTGYLPDRYYRHFIHSLRAAHQNNVLAPLAQRVEKVYLNDWVLPVAQRWQLQLDAAPGTWAVPTGRRQRDFFAYYAQPLLNERRKVFVVISDALRFECGTELYQRLQGHQRYQTELNHLVTGLPSYTQLGMAALLPHQQLRLESPDAVWADGRSTQGMANRIKILQASLGEKATALSAEDFMQLPSSTTGRELSRNHDVVYIYHNQIDKVGDDLKSEDKVFEAARQEIEYLLSIVDRIRNINGTHIFITADHGFLYQQSEVEESEFSGSQLEGEIWKESRRYVLGQPLKGGSALMSWTAEQLGLEGETQVLIPRGVNRLRRQGAGSRYVHGGASLQEVVVPLVKVRVVREQTTSQVSVDVLRMSNNRITTGRLPVSFIQQEPVTDKILARTIRARLLAGPGEEVISDEVTRVFDSADANVRTREFQHTFTISPDAAKRYRNQEVKLRLDEPVPNTDKWKQYQEFSYTLLISFTSDFDSF
ncbi:BREX-1 system phosphatase PglZ type A [Hymenobacter artigasi]|uniref:Uncharacterized protein (TIGR02687 family) n=1 Tax=Hymenobacter artigasi TaxID=2719616 RepID=A0ABX1HMX6_9BACT|nr:BREX-1 system phosphatase PglZ type A [Hymenobacter artigasi]NKI91606.1 uncharacterized protein (TIGR02687 family) [Hymenobacter artigasi]